MKNLFILLLVFNTFLFAEMDLADQGCSFSKQNIVTVGWKAYKTPSKLGVSGVFDDVNYEGVKKGKSLKELLEGSSVIIKTHSVNSKNEGRDLKLVNSFFKIMSDDVITAKVTDITSKGDKNIVNVAVSMNGITKRVPMNYTYNKGIFTASGVIDLFDFQASQALKSINKACFDLHRGKTWNDVTISFKMNINCDNNIAKKQ